MQESGLALEADDSAQASSSPSGALKVMVVDDSKTIRKSAESLLTKEGCEVFTANDGFEALAKIAEHRPNLIFIDIMMPRLDGYQTCALIKNNRLFKSTPVICYPAKIVSLIRLEERLLVQNNI